MPVKLERKIRVWSFIAAGLVVLVAALAWQLPADASSDAAPEGVLARVGAVDVTQAEVEELVSASLLKIERDRHQLLERGMNQLVETRLLDAEAEARGISVEELIEQEVTSKVSPPTAEDIDFFYEQNKARINQPKEQIAGQIEAYLSQQERQNLQVALIDRLRESHGVTLFLEPMRLDVADDGPAKGPAEAPITIVEFSDFECPYCKRIVPTLEQVTEKYGDKVRLVFKQFPLPIHANARVAAEASLCAGDQGKFWEMHDTMFEDGRNLTADKLKGWASELELDTEAFEECLDSGQFADTVEADLAAGSKVGVTGTPAMFINGRFLSGAVPYETIAAVIDDELRRQGIE